MLILNGNSFQKLPLENLFPYNNDLMLALNQNISLRLCSLCKENGEVFSILSIMRSNENIFGKDINQRITDFVEIFPSRLERKFSTNKATYVFFDLEEQKFLMQYFSIPGLSCGIEIYDIETNTPLELESLNFKLKREIISALNKLNVRAVMTVSEYVSMYNAYDKEKQIAPMNKYFKFYPKLSGFQTKARVDKYFKKLKAKYHPDNNLSDDTSDKFRRICQDSNFVKSSYWYSKLR